MPKFDMGDVGGGTAAPNEMRWVYLSDVVPNERNEIYSTEGIESLADDILVHGLLQPPLVHPVEGGKYKIISGHRRILALKKLADSGNAEFNKIQVVIDNDNDETSLGLKLISANAENRILSNAELLAQTQEYMALLTEYKKKENLPGKVRDMVAKKLNVSTGTVSELLAIGKNLQEPLLTHFKEGWINKTVAVEMSKLDDEHQQWVADEIWNSHRQFSVKEIKEMKARAIKAANFESEEEIPEEAIRNGEELGILATSSSAPISEDVSEDVTANEEVNEEVNEDVNEDVNWDPDMGWVPMDSEWQKLVMNARENGIYDATPCVICHNATGCQGCCRKCHINDDCGCGQYNNGSCAKLEAEAKMQKRKEKSIESAEQIDYELENNQTKMKLTITQLVSTCGRIKDKGCNNCPIFQNGKCLVNNPDSNWLRSLYT